ncbi:serine hydrolase [Polynucleobacter sp.]|uniref:serine hydrolase domain-containing protein n=1 Tax=Polynucleobacter sp. TaxID=2029855 RepID=UPI00333F9147
MQSWNKQNPEDAIGSLEDLYGGKLDLEQRIETIRHLDRFFPCSEITPAPQTSSITERLIDLSDLRFKSHDQNLSFQNYLDINCVTGLYILKDGIKVYENYFHGNQSNTPWCAFSVTKSVTSTLVGAAIADGSIYSVNDLVSDYLPQLSVGAYSGVRLEDVLRMSSGVLWDETYGDPQSERRKMLEVKHQQQAGAILDFLKNLDRASEPGYQWKYNTGYTFVVGALLKAAVQRSLAIYLQEKIWHPLGMEFSARWWLDSPMGQEFGGGGIQLRLRDLARFGEFLLKGGLIEGRQILPSDWIKNASSSFKVQGSSIDYGYLFWLVPPDKGPLHQGAFKARGIYGQYLYMNPNENLVVAAFGARPKARAADSPIDDDDFLTSLVQYLS